MKLPGLRLRLATSQLIRQWTQRRLPNGKIVSGQVLNPKTMNYQTLKPEKDGLFCERIFGPVHDSICACGRQPLRGQKFCPRCEVEYTSTRVRRYRLGYIQLTTATAHIWFLKGRPSYFSLFLNLPKKKIECLLYCTRNISRTIFPRELESLNFYSIQKTHHIVQHKGHGAYLRNLIKHIVSRRARVRFWSFASEKGYWRLNKNITKFQYVQRIRISKTGSNITPLLPEGWLGIAKQCSIFLNILQVPRNSEKTTASLCDPFISSITLFYYFLLENFVFDNDKQIRKFSNSHWIFESNWLKDQKKNLSLNQLRCSMLNFYNRLNFQSTLHHPVIATGSQSECSLKLAMQKKSRWQKGGLRDSALYFGFSLVSKMLSWQMTAHWFSFVYFLIQSPQKGDFLNKFYQGPPGLVHAYIASNSFARSEHPWFTEGTGEDCASQSRLFCLTGVQLMRTWLTQLTQYQCQDGRLLEIQIRLDLLQFERCEPLSDNEFVQRILLFRRFKYLRSFRHTQMNPASMILSVLPVLPPDLRPIIQLDNNQIAVSDLNKLYQTVLLRNKRLSRLTLASGDSNFHCLNSEVLQYAQRLLQESVDSLMENGTASSFASQPSGNTRRALKSLSDLFKGKKGRFRQNLLGKRVDYSGRSVIVVGPYLRIYECGLPKEIAYELFQPFILRILMFQNQAQTILGAKKLFQQKPQFIWDLLKEIVHSHPILLNRAPTLHRLSIQAFQPRLIEGKAILLHPLVCAAFNADFDGDQMGVHLPLCFEARAEAWKITWSQNNLFSVATGSPSCSPSQDMILGSSFLTTRNIQKLGLNFLKTPTLYKNTTFAFHSEGRKRLDLFKQTSAGFLNQTVFSSGSAASCIAANFASLEASSWKQWSSPRENQTILTSLVQKRNLLKSLLFKKPFFFKISGSRIASPSDAFIPSNKGGEFRETTLSSINIVSFSQKFHPFWHGANALHEVSIAEARFKYLVDARSYVAKCRFPVVPESSSYHCLSYPGTKGNGRWAKPYDRVQAGSNQHSMFESVDHGIAGGAISGRLRDESYIQDSHSFNQTSIWCTYNPILHQFETEKKNQKLIEIRINLHGQFQKFRSQFFQQYHSSGLEVLRKFRTTYGRIQFYESLSLF